MRARRRPRAFRQESGPRRSLLSTEIGYSRRLGGSDRRCSEGADGAQVHLSAQGRPRGCRRRVWPVARLQRNGGRRCGDDNHDDDVEAPGDGDLDGGTHVDHVPCPDASRSFDDHDDCAPARGQPAQLECPHAPRRAAARLGCAVPVQQRGLKPGSRPQRPELLELTRRSVPLRRQRARRPSPWRQRRVQARPVHRVSRPR